VVKNIYTGRKFKKESSTVSKDSSFDGREKHRDTWKKRSRKRLWAPLDWEGPTRRSFWGGRRSKSKKVEAGLLEIGGAGEERK